jgi:hypothetical protein
MAGCVTALLALGSFAIPLVADDAPGDPAPATAPVDHRNDLLVVRPVHPPAPVSSVLVATARVLVVALAIGGLASTPLRLRARHRDRRSPLASWPPWSQPSRRGPPALLVG